MNILFTCTSCGAQHEALNPEEPPPLAAEELAKLRVKWLKAADAHTPVKEDEMGAGVLRASIAYFGTFRLGVPKVPETLKSVNSAAGFRLVCVTCPVEKESP